MDVVRLDPPQKPTRGQIERVSELLGRPVQGSFEIVVVDAEGQPVVLRNEPFLSDGTPMPTTYWLVGRDLSVRVARLEGAGGVRAAEGAVPGPDLAAAHRRYAAEREARIGPDHRGPRPFGGVGGTRRGVKCLHAHLAHELAVGGDPVGRWVIDQLEAEAEEDL